MIQLHLTQQAFNKPLQHTKYRARYWEKKEKPPKTGLEYRWIISLLAHCSRLSNYVGPVGAQVYTLRTDGYLDVATRHLIRTLVEEMCIYPEYTYHV